MPSTWTVRSIAGPALAGAAVAVGLLVVALPAAAQQTEPAKPKTKYDNQVLSTTALTGQKVVVLPLSLYQTDSVVAALPATSPWHARTTALAALDSLLSEMLLGRAPGVQWVVAAETRRLTRRAAGLLPPAEQLGQDRMRFVTHKELPDPLRSNLRTLAAMGGGRYALIPGVLVLVSDSTGIAADFTMVVGDPRTGAILWRTIARGAGPTPGAAVQAALNTIIPPESDTP